jgi:hypothetical protein
MKSNFTSPAAIRSTMSISEAVMELAKIDGEDPAGKVMHARASRIHAIAKRIQELEAQSEQLRDERRSADDLGDGRTEQQANRSAWDTLAA